MKDVATCLARNCLPRVIHLTEAIRFSVIFVAKVLKGHNITISIKVIYPVRNVISQWSHCDLTCDLTVWDICEVTVRSPCKHTVISQWSHNVRYWWCCKFVPLKRNNISRILTFICLHNNEHNYYMIIHILKYKMQDLGALVPLVSW